jgi:nucleotide-binding universal stress UspA family protein
MPDPKRFHVLVATDGSMSAQIALMTAVRFPWPAGADGSIVVAKYARSELQRSVLLVTLDRLADVTAVREARILRRRWPDGQARVVKAAPIQGIVAEARRVKADVVVVGWRGHGPLQRLLAGSVSRGVAKRGPCSVLVVRETRRAFRRIVIGIDGSPHSARALEFLTTVTPPRGGRVTLLQAVDMMPVPRQGLAPAALRASVAADVARINRERHSAARECLEEAARTLSAAGWKVDQMTTVGAPLRALLATVAKTRADVLIVGARGVTGVRRVLLGSVAEGACHASPVPVLIVR